METLPDLWPAKGHLNIDQYNFMKDLLKDRKVQYAIETGFATGRSALCVLDNCKELKKLISIDIDFDYAFRGLNADQNSGREMLKKLQNKFSIFVGIEGNSRVILNDAFFAENFPDGIDFCFVDGDHSYDGCYSDLQNIFPYVNSGGIILVDDYKSKPPACFLPEVTKACDDFFSVSSHLDRKEWNVNGKGFCIFYKK